jgi:hypothetical protein
MAVVRAEAVCRKPRRPLGRVGAVILLKESKIVKDNRIILLQLPYVRAKGIANIQALT